MTLTELRESGRAVITVTEAAALLELDERTVRRACEDGQLPSIRVGKRLLIPRERLLSLLSAPDNSESASPTDAPIATL